MISIILPAKLPEPYLPTLIQDIEAYLAKFLTSDFEIAVQTQKGLSYAVRKGVEKANGEIVAVLDVDGQHDPFYLVPMINLVRNGDYDLVVGSRYVDGGTSNLSFFRSLTSRFFCWFANWMLGLNVRDNMTGYVVGKRQIFEKMHVANQSFKFLVELLCYTDRVFEYPIKFQPRKDGVSKASFRQGIQTLRLIWKLRAIVRDNHPNLNIRMKNDN